MGAAGVDLGAIGGWVEPPQKNVTDIMTILGMSMVYCWVYIISHDSVLYYTGWWFGTCFIVPYIGNNHPN